MDVVVAEKRLAPDLPRRFAAYSLVHCASAPAATELISTDFLESRWSQRRSWHRRPFRYNGATVETTVQALRCISLFADLSDDILARMAGVAHIRRHNPGQMIILGGDSCQAAYFIAEGQVRVYRLSPEGRAQTLARLGPGQAFNTVPPFLPHGVNHATVEALTSVTLYVIAADDLRRLVRECPELALTILKDFAGRLDHLTDLVESLALRSVRGRLARFLLEHAEADQITRRWTQEEMAGYLGTVRDMVGRTLRAFADAGLVRMDRQRIVLLDREGLEAESQR